MRAISGLEWLAEIDEEEIEPDEDFYQICKIGKRLFYEKNKGISSKQSSEIWKLLNENQFIDKNGSVTNQNFENFNQLIPDELSEYKEKIISALIKKIKKT